MNILLRTTLLAAGLWLWSSPGAIADSCVPDQIETATLQARNVRQNLAKLPTDYEWPTALEPDVQTTLMAMKAQLGDLLGAYMRCAPRDLDPAKAMQDLAQGLAVPEPAVGAPVHYGDRLVFKAERPINQPGLIAVTVEFAIPCGTDSVLFVFAPEGGAWKEVLRWQSQPYAEISGAFASFGYVISPSDPAGRWFLVAKTVAPWCSSTWSIIRYAVLRPRPDRQMPKILYAAEESIWWGGEDFGQLSVGEKEFDLRFQAESIDPGIHSRVWVRHFAVEGDEVRRVAPIALSPRDFADEWMTAPWALASSWSKTDARGQLKTWHERLQALRHSAHYEYGSIHRCGDGAARYQVELKSDDPDNNVYLRLEGSPAAFDMIAVGAKPDPSCGGPDLLDRIAAQ
jgi:hypothetical protein